MKKIDFHHHVKDRLSYACAVVKTVRERGLTVALWSTDKARLSIVDNYLWELDPYRFLPHAFVGSPEAASSPILLSEDLEQLNGQVLILLDDQLPPAWEKEFDRFERIVDIVGLDANEVEASRLRWTAYKAAGVELEAYNRES